MGHDGFHSSLSVVRCPPPGGPPVACLKVHVNIPVSRMPWLCLGLIVFFGKCLQRGMVLWNVCSQEAARKKKVCVGEYNWIKTICSLELD